MTSIFESRTAFLLVVILAAPAAMTACAADASDDTPVNDAGPRVDVADARPRDGGSSDTGSAAASDASNATSDADDSAARDAGARDAFADAISLPSCVSFINAAAPVAIRNEPQARPAPAAGTIVPGTYHLTDAILYTGPGGASGNSGRTRQETVVFTSSSFSGIAKETPSQAESSYAFDYTVAQDRLSLRLTCPASINAIGDYSATSTEIRFFEVGRVLVYTKQ